MKAGGGRLVAQVLETLKTGGHGVTAKPTPGPRTAARLARESIDAGADLILALGGDGTINEVAEGVIGSATPLAILPGGTANVLCRELGIASSAQKAAASIGDYRAERIAVGAACCSAAPQRHFLAMAGVGLDAHIVYRMSAELKKKWGKLAYWIGGFSQLVRELEEFEVEIDGGGYRCSFALVSKVRNYGGDLRIARSRASCHIVADPAGLLGLWDDGYTLDPPGVPERAHRPGQPEAVARQTPQPGTTSPSPEPGWARIAERWRRSTVTWNWKLMPTRPRLRGPSARCCVSGRA